MSTATMPTQGAQLARSAATMTSFEGLPIEIVLTIMEEVPDLPTLYALICASPQAADLFNKYSVHILNFLIPRSMPKELQDFARWIAVVGSLKTPNGPYATEDPTLENFTIKYRKDNGRRAQRERLIRDLTPTKGPRHVLLAAHRIQRLERVCLARMLDLLHELEPSYPHGPTVKLDEESQSDNLFEQPPESFRPSASWAPSWIERFRVQRALWQIMVGSYASFIPGLPEAGVSRENREAWHDIFNPYKPLEFVVGRWSMGYQRGDVYDCVHDTLHDLLGCSPTKLFTGRASESEVEHVQSQLSKISPKGWEHDEPQPVETEEGDIMGQSRRHIDCAGYGTRFYVLEYRGAVSSGPLKRSDFRAVSRLGLAVWDTERMLQLGLAQPSRRRMGLATPASSDSHSAAINDQSAANDEDFVASDDDASGSEDGSVVSDSTLDDFEGRLCAWRSVFLQELPRLKGTSLGDEVLSPQCYELLEMWKRREVTSGFREVMNQLTHSTANEVDEAYDGPVESEDMREFRDDEVHDIIDRMEAEQAWYHGREVNARAGGDDISEAGDASEDGDADDDNDTILGDLTSGLFSVEV
ncbi:uncharacterized protein DNG_10052 [Cephalotrichum gorgonifer]|uniref:F-box domain-containing protein n=1 Tax=Cephalotrichum gorgonifer TaxID=2041049 RepID=A0AAE8N8I3_9PEZI|nr:uncharacterized protein DNG_10052 [Cephalotrichum gorgonifer]